MHPDSESEHFKPLKRKTLNKSDPSKRFKTAPTEDEVRSLTKGYVNTTSWSVKVFNEWRYVREGEKKCPENLFQLPTTKYWLSCFINEVRKVDGKPYPPRTIHQILPGLQQHMLDLNYCSPKFLDCQN